MKRGDMWDARNPGKGKVQIVHVEMDDVEFFGALHYVFEHYIMTSKLVDPSLAQAQRTLATRDEPRRRFRVATGEERNFVSHLDEFFGQIRHYPLPASVKLRRDTFIEWCHLGDLHFVLTLLSEQ